MEMIINVILLIVIIYGLKVLKGDLKKLKTELITRKKLKKIRAENATIRKLREISKQRVVSYRDFKEVRHLKNKQN